MYRYDRKNVSPRNLLHIIWGRETLNAMLFLGMHPVSVTLDRWSYIFFVMPCWDFSSGCHWGFRERKTVQPRSVQGVGFGTESIPLTMTELRRVIQGISVPTQELRRAMNRDAQISRGSDVVFCNLQQWIPSPESVSTFVFCNAWWIIFITRFRSICFLGEDGWPGYQDSRIQRCKPFLHLSSTNQEHTFL